MAQLADVHTTRLDISQVPDLVGKESRKRAKELYALLEDTNMPIYGVGDSGTSKTATLKWLCKVWSLKHHVPAYYLQLSQEDTKTSVILGFRLHNGSLIPVDGLLARAAKENAIVLLDEITQSTTNMILMLSAFDGKESVITIGDEIISASDMKIMFASNRSSHAGNRRVPQAFLNRVFTVPFDWPEDPNEEIAISLAVAKKDLKSGEIARVPYSLVQYVVSLIRELRRPGDFPLSVRNVAKSILYFETISKGKKFTGMDPYFTQGSVEPIHKRVTKRITGREATDTQTLISAPIRSFYEFVSLISPEEFRKGILMSCGYYADAEGLEEGFESFRQQMWSKVL